MTAAIIVGMLAAGGTYLILQRGIVRMALGFTLLGHAATTLLVAAGGVDRRGIPFIGVSGTPADPLPQAFALTAIVISFGITAFLLTLAFRGRDVLGHDDVEDPEVPDDEPVLAHLPARAGDASPRAGGGSDAGPPDDTEVTP
jgi:multicomponent Na+:H+ antiporter subunit C